jgi:CHAT domain-containing protein
MRYCFCLFFCTIQFLFAQEPKQELRLQYSLALKDFNAENPTILSDQKALILFEKIAKLSPNGIKEALIIAEAAQKAGVLVQSLNKNKEAKSHYINSLELAKKYKLADSVSFRGMLYLSGIYFYAAQYDSCLHYLSQAEKIYDANPKLSEAERLFNTKGVLLFEAGNFRQSLLYFKKAETLKDNDEYSNKNNQALALQFLNEPDSTFKILINLERVFPDESDLKINIASALNSLNKPSEAIRYLNKIKGKNMGLSFYNAYGIAYFKLNNLNQSKFYFELAKNKNVADKKGIDAGLTVYYLGLIAVQQGDLKLALNFFQEALLKLNHNFTSSDIRVNPTANFDNFNSFFVLDVLHQKAICFEKLYFKTADNQYLTASVETWEAMKITALGITKTYNQENARFDIVSKIYPKFQDYTSFLYQVYLKNNELKYAEKAFEIGEEAKAIVLEISISESKLKSNSGIPQSLLNQEKNLIISLNALKRKLENKTNLEQKNIQKLITDTEINLTKLNATLEAYPNHKKSKFEKKSTLSISEVRQNLRKEELLISYINLKNKVLLFGISKNEFVTILISDKKELDNKLRTLKNEIKIGKNSNLYFELNKILIGPFKDILKNKSELVFISEGEANGLPIETLKDNEGKYLIEKYAVSYLFSVKFLKSQEIISKNNSVLAFAPFTSKESSYFLASSESEILGIPNGTAFLNLNANRTNFLKNYQRFGIIHLATHAVSNIDEPLKSFIRFSDKTDSNDKYYLYEFSPGQLKNTSLVFLSACDSYGSTFMDGEGVRGLSRGFYLAGSESIISSLWKAEDFSTSFISRSFYTYLNAGKTYQKAIQLAKIDFLNDPEMAQFQLPKYWAPLIFVGHQSQESGFSFAKLALILAISISAFFIIKKSKFKL